MKISTNISPQLILSHEEYGFEVVQKAFKSAQWIFITTYNLGAFPKDPVLSEIRNVGNSIPILIVANAPILHSPQPDFDAFQKYLDQCEPSKLGAKVNVIFSYINHSKIIATDKIAYIGSANYSDSSKNNFEAGILLNDPTAIEQIVEKALGYLEQSAIPYFTSQAAGVLLLYRLGESLKIAYEYLQNQMGRESNYDGLQDPWTQLRDITDILTDDKYPTRFLSKEHERHANSIQNLLNEIEEKNLGSRDQYLSEAMSSEEFSRDYLEDKKQDVLDTYLQKYLDLVQPLIEQVIKLIDCNKSLLDKIPTQKDLYAQLNKKRGKR